MDERRIDLSPLDPREDGPRFERLVSRIVTDAVAARASRPQVVIPILLLTRWSRPLLAGAAAIAIVAAGSLFTRRSPSQVPESLAEAVGIPASVARWAERGEVPSVSELIASVATSNAGANR